MTFQLLIRAAGLAAMLWLQAATAAPPATEAFFKDPDIAQAVLSPSGTRLALTSAKGVQRVGLVVMDLADGKMKRIAQFTEGDIWNVQWVNEDRLVFGVIDFSDGSGRPNGAPGLFAVDADGRNFRQLISRRGRPFITDGNDSSERRLDWNHYLLRVPAPRPGEHNEDVLVVQFTPAEDGIQTPLWLNTRNGRTRDINFNPPPHTVGWLADSRGQPRVAFTRSGNSQAAFWLEPDGKSWRQLYEGSLLRQPFSVNSVDDAGNLYVTRHEGPQGYLELARYDFERKQPEAKPLVQTPGFDFNGHLLSDGSGAPLGVRMTVDSEATVWFNPAMKALQQQADKFFPDKVNRITCSRCGTPDMVALVESFSDRDPGRLYLYKARPAEGEKAWTSLGRVREDVDPAQMSPLELYRTQARDGGDLPVWVTRKAGANGPLPAVVLVHGGPWVRGSAWRWNGEAQFLASRGYAVIEPEFRGGTGYGEKHFKAGFKQWGQAMQNDVADALLWAQKQGIASDKACIVGASYGGYSTLMGLVNDPGLYRCGVAWVAVTDLELLLKGSWWVDDDTGSSARKYSMPEMIGDLQKDAAMITANSPVKQAARIKAPVLLAFGEDDRRVPLAHGKRMRDALREAGNEPVWVTYPGEGHGFAVLKNRVDFAQRLEAFLARNLQP